MMGYYRTTPDMSSAKIGETSNRNPTGELTPIHLISSERQALPACLSVKSSRQELHLHKGLRRAMLGPWCLSVRATRWKRLSAWKFRHIGCVMTHVISVCVPLAGVYPIEVSVTRRLFIYCLDLPPTGLFIGTEIAFATTRAGFVGRRLIHWAYGSRADD